ncbi:hypothetical protein D3C75_1220130 [compost metagenome]
MLDDSVLVGLGDGAIITKMEIELVDGIVAELVQADIAVKAVQRINPTLEQLFLQLTEGEHIE